MRRQPILNACAISVVCALLACSAKVGGPGGGAAQTVSVEVQPGSAEVTTSQAYQFTAQVTGTSNVAVTWVVDESGGGAVNQSGLYTAPASPGTYHVRAVSAADTAVSGTAAVSVVAPPPAGSVTISPKTVSVAAGGKVTFTATVANLSSSAVTWSVSEASGCGSVSGGVYTAPATAATCHVVARSVADTTKSDTATVTVTAAPPPITISISPASGAVDACKTLSFTATVSGSTNQGVTWSVLEGATGGSVSGGVYTAPSTAGTYHVVATAQASSSAVAQAAVTVADHVLSVAVNPVSATVVAGATQQFTATVTTTCGSFTATAAQ